MPRPAWICRTFLAIPIGAETYSEALRMVVDVYRAVGRVLSQMGPYAYGVADEGWVRAAAALPRGRIGDSLRRDSPGRVSLRP